MNLQEGIAKLKELLFKDEVKAELKFESAKLADGVTAIEWEGDLMPGVIVSVIDTNGLALPMPVGQYQLEDGTTFEIVDENGTADKVVKAGEAEAPAPEPDGLAPKEAEVKQSEAPATAVTSAPKRVIKSQVEEHVFHLEIEGVEPIAVDFSSMFTKLNDENKELKTKLEASEAFNKNIAEVVSAIADEPIKAPTEKVVTRKEQSAEIKEAFRKLTARK